MNKKAIIKIILMLFISLSITNIKAATNQEIEASRKKLEDMVVSTAISYLNNNIYTDYDQFAMDASTTMSYINSKGKEATFTNTSYNWRTTGISPEEINRKNIFSIDCSSFSNIVYKYSLGYNFSEYYNLISDFSYLTFDIENRVFKRYAIKDTDTFNTRIGLFGRGNAGRNYMAAAAYEIGIPMTKPAKTDSKYKYQYIIENVEAGKKYTFNDKQLGVYLYRIKDFDKKNPLSEDSKMTQELKNAYEEMKSLLRPGDMINFLQLTKTKDENGKEKDITTGHSMIYVGDIFGNGKPGLIHSGGSDYYTRSGVLNSLSTSDDKYSVRYDSLEDYLYKNRLRGGRITYINVVRPINKMQRKSDGTFENITDDITMDLKIGNKKIETQELTLNSNSRTAFKWLRTEQYARTLKPAINVLDFDKAVQEYNTESSQYNSVNQGDAIEYVLYLENVSNKGYCIGNNGGKYYTKDTCEKAGYSWETLGKNLTFKNITIEAKIPKNTEYVSCTNSCKKINDETIQWTGISLGTSAAKELSYTVKAKENKTITNTGMKVKMDGKTLQMGEITTKVNPTLNKINAEKFRKTIVEFTNAISGNNPKIKYGSSSTSYAVPSDGSTPSTFTSYGFVKNIYYNATGIKLGDLGGGTIKDAIFNKHKDYDSYAKKTEEEINELEKTSHKNINKMLVKGFYGGRYLKGNDNGDRPGRLRMTDLEFGDIIVVFAKSGDTVAGTSALYLYLGNDSITTVAGEKNNGENSIENDNKGNFIRFNSGNKLDIYTSKIASYSSTSPLSIKSKSAYQFFNELWSKDLFVVLRPTQLYGTTVTYSGSTILGKKSSVEYGTYKNLKDLTSTKEYTITFDYKDYLKNKTYTHVCENTCYQTITGGNTFGGWYKEYVSGKYTNEITNDNLTLLKKDNHTIYPKWIKKSIKLPKAKIEGYHIDSWYSDKNYANLVAKAGSSYSITANKTLYAKWMPNTYKIEYNANGGTGTMEPSNHTYGVAANLSKNKFTKSGYTLSGWSTTANGNVEYKPEGEINLTTENGAVVKLYAKWKKQEPNEFEVKLTIKNGTADATSKIVKGGSEVTFDIKPNKGYTKCQTDSSTQKIIDNKLTIKNVTQNTSINITCVGITYTVIYHPNGGTGTMENSSHTYGKSSPLSPNKYERVGYSFKGWDTSATNKVKYIDKQNVINLTTSKNFNLYAVWNEKTYIIKYELNGGKLYNQPTSYTISSSDITLGEPKKEGYKFKGWTTEENNKPQKTVVIKKGSTGNKKYIANYEIGKYVITYKSDKYGKITGITNETLDYKANPKGTTKTINEGYKTLKWAVDKDVLLTDGTEILAGDSITEEQIKKIVVKEDITITAYHYAKKYKVTYKDGTNGKISGIKSEEVSYSSNLLGTKTKANQGYKIKAWTANKTVKLSNGKKITSGKEITDIKQIVVTEDITLTPIFEAASYKIKYQVDSNGSINGIKEETVKYPNTISSTKITSIDDNYEFAYWTANKDVTLKDNTVLKKGDPINEDEITQIVATSDITLTANYKQSAYNVYYLNFEDIIITSEPKELIGKTGHIVGPEVERDRWDKEIVYVIDKDVTLEDGTIIEAGKPMKSAQLKSIKVSEDLNITPRYASDFKFINFEEINVDLILGIILAISIAFTLIYILKTNQEIK